MFINAEIAIAFGPILKKGRLDLVVMYTSTSIVSLPSDNSHVSGGEKSRAAEEDIFL